MTMTPVLETHIYRDEAGQAWVKRAGVSVKQVVVSLQQMSFRPEEVVRNFPYLMLSEVCAVQTFYHDHRQEIDEALLRDGTFVEAMRVSTPQAQATQRVREHMGIR